MFSSFIHVSMYQCFIPYYGQIIFHYMIIPNFIYPFIGQWRFGWFAFLAIMNNAAMNIHV